MPSHLLRNAGLLLATFSLGFSSVLPVPSASDWKGIASGMDLRYVTAKKASSIGNSRIDHPAHGSEPIAFAIGMHPDAVIKNLPLGIAEKILDRDVPEQLKIVFPSATSFSKKVAQTHSSLRCIRGTPESQTVAGFAFWTTKLQPQERGYDGPIKMLVGLDLDGKLTGVLVTEQHEPYGYFSVGQPSFPRQFKGKDLRDPFKVGADVAAVSRASISVNSASRAIRNSARIAARAFLPKGEAVK